ncbi:MAG: NAD-dependent epimerase/dehydratase family protein [Bacteroidia bacterium]|nr:NAD-dependent epimerase/dehydratase family protein [Bacteroidia bacterium]MCZ2278484.1 NAD-dependent epimerase/dehydratase family protein [Bacteroidia bacterium]
MKETILVLGSSGQIGLELVGALRSSYGDNRVLASDIKKSEKETGWYQNIDVLDTHSLAQTIQQYQITQVYLLAALLSATAEQKPKLGWKLNMEGLFNILDLAKEKNLRVFWPSSIAAFGPTTPREQTPQVTIMEPTSVYGISKLAGERWCEYYFHRYGVDVRSIRYPGLISFKSPPGGGTTDYAIHIFHQALLNGRYASFLSRDTLLPMMYMPDAIRGTIELMEAPADKIKVRSSYNFAAFSFTPQMLADEIIKHIPNFKITYNPDFRQALADSWPQSIDDSAARLQWGWEPHYSLADMTSEMIQGVSQELKKSTSHT